MQNIDFYNADGAYIDSAVSEDDVEREGWLIEFGGYLYAWNQRNSQWRRVNGTVAVSSSEKADADE